jgi:hypothetical protein
MSQPVSGARRRARWIIAGGVVIAVAIGLALFQPWQLFIDKTVDEAAPVAADVPTDATSSTAASPAPPTTAPALQPTEFRSIAHGTKGQALLVSQADGRRFLRIENLDTDNGPDLFVYLSPAPPEGGSGDFGDGALNLGVLKGNKGNQNYEIPADTDLSRYESVVIWCRRFSVAFGAAPVPA